MDILIFSIEFVTQRKF